MTRLTWFVNGSKSGRVNPFNLTRIIEPKINLSSPKILGPKRKEHLKLISAQKENKRTLTLKFYLLIQSHSLLSHSLSPNPKFLSHSLTLSLFHSLSLSLSLSLSHFFLCCRRRRSSLTYQSLSHNSVVVAPSSTATARWIRCSVFFVLLRLLRWSSFCICIRFYFADYLLRYFL